MTIGIDIFGENAELLQTYVDIGMRLPSIYDVNFMQDYDYAMISQYCDGGGTCKPI